MTVLEEPPAFWVETIFCLLQGVRVVSTQLLLLSLGQAIRCEIGRWVLGVRLGRDPVCFVFRVSCVVLC